MTQTPSVVVLAGGSNSRFWPLRAKSLFPIAGRTLLEHHIDGLIAAGCRRFVVVANPETREDVAAAVAGLAADVSVAVQTEARGMGDALLVAAAHEPKLARAPLMVTQAHDVVEPSLYQRFVEAARSNDASGLLAGQRVRSYFPGGYLALDGARVTGLVEKPPPGSEPSDVVSLVVHLHRRPDLLLERIRDAYAEPNPADDHYERAVASLLDGHRYDLVAYEGGWQAVKYPWHVLGVMDLALRDLAPSEKLPEGVSGPVVLEEGVRILPGARVVGPAWVGAGALIGTTCWCAAR
ncbi:MAG: sugar phosphate nucleotidyltransferase [Dehalococcoidia bacterium]